MSKFNWNGIEKVEYNGKKGIWRTVGGRRIFISDGQSLPDAMKASGKFDRVLSLSKRLPHVDVTDNWIKFAQPLSGTFQEAGSVKSVDGKEYKENGNDIVFEKKIKEHEEETANWFRNNLWGHFLFQYSIKKPEGIHSADLILTKPHPLLKGNTVEIKSVFSPRLDQITKNIKSGEGQSNNILIDITHAAVNHPTSKVFHECIRYFDNPDHNWLDSLLVKKDEKLLFAITRR